VNVGAAGIDGLRTKGLRMNFLVVYAHPVPTSFNFAVFETVKRSLTDAGHDIRIVDLYEENFQPVLSRADREAYLENTSFLSDQVTGHIENLRWAEGLVFVFPIWYYGPPAILKGWFERVWLPGVTFEVSQKKGQTTSSCIKHIKRLVVVTSSGSPAWWMFVIGNPCKRFFLRGLRVLFNLRCKSTWMQLYEMNVIDDDERKRFLAKVEHRMARL
jgi:putative NADPH-quinone reductase